MSGRQSIEDIFVEHGRPFPPESGFRELIQKKHALFERSQIRLFPGVETILAWIKIERIRTALVTGSAKRSVDHVMEESVLARFDAVITAEDVARGKPDPEPYERALEELGVKAENTIVIENAPMGIRSAKSAGVTCYAIETTLPRRYLAEADEVFSDHVSLFEYLKSRFGMKERCRW
jgi:HAD superfamily hydrolase (TIGR01509 family)